MLGKALKVAMVVSLLAPATLLHGQFKRVDPAQPPYSNGAPSQPYPGNPDPSAPDGPDDIDPADAQHAVARLSFLSGDVNVQRGESTGTVAAAVNAPLVANDRIQTGTRSSAEIELDTGIVFRVAENSDLGFGALDSSGFQAQLGTGTVIYRVVRPSQLAGELDTPNIAIRPLGAVDLRVSVLPDGTTLVQVRAGEAELIGPAGSEHLSAGHAYSVHGNPTEPEFQETGLVPRDGFDGWSEARDSQLAQSQSAHYLPPGVAGGADLDANGSWVPSEYGQVWTPSGMPATWSPYSNGFWTYENYYGWTWVDYSSWGWAPYHYGRWFRNANYGWCWWPGARVGVHPWRPALVGFYGWGGGYRGLGWVPLAPRERFHPWWGGGARPFGGGTYLSASYRNASYRGAVTFASYNGFAGPGQRFSHLSHEQLSGAALLGGRIPVTPARSAYSFSQRQAFSTVHTNTYTSRSFVSADRLRNSSSSFNGTRYNSAPSWNRIGAERPAASSPAPRNSYTPTPRPSKPADSGWGRFGDPGRNNPNKNNFDQQGFRSNPGSVGENGWHQFGRPASPSGNSSRDSSRNGAWNNGNRGGGSWNNGNQSRQNFSAPQRSSPAPHSNGGGSSNSHGNNSGGGRGHR